MSLASEATNQEQLNHHPATPPKLIWSESYTCRAPPAARGVTRLRYVRHDWLLATSWSGHASLYEGDRLVASHESGSPVLDGTEHDSKLYLGELTNDVVCLDVETSTRTVLGRHEAGVRAVEWSLADDVLVTGSWDRTVKVWDVRMKVCAASAHVPERVFCMDVVRNESGLVLLGLGDGALMALDARRFSDRPLFLRQNSLGHQLRCVRSFQRGAGVILSSIEGRVAIEDFQASSEHASARRFGFKCHRKDDSVFPVHCVSPLAPEESGNQVFATGGGDGTVEIWDAATKRKCAKVALPNDRLSTSCSSLCFDARGTKLAVAESYAFELGEEVPGTSEAIRVLQPSGEEAPPE